MYKKSTYRFPSTPFCTAFSQDKFIVPDLMKASNLTDLGQECPMKKGTYTIDGAYLPLKDLPQNAFPSADYMLEITFTKTTKTITKFRIYAQIINISNNN